MAEKATKTTKKDISSKTSTKKSTTKKVSSKTSTAKKAQTPKTKSTKPKKVANQKVVKETKNLNEEATFSVWIDILILIFVLIMFAVILYGNIV